MKKLIVAALATAMGAASLASPASAQGFSAASSAANSVAAGPLELVQHRHRHGGRHYYRAPPRHTHHHHYHRRSNSNAVAAGVAGLAVGALVGSAVTANSQPRYAPAPAYAAPNDWHAYCASKYRSYDVRTGTFMGYDGIRRPCR